MAQLRSGGAPFIEDSDYLSGLLRVTNCQRAMITERRADCVPLPFCGKLDLEDLPALADTPRLPPTATVELNETQRPVNPGGVPNQADSTTLRD